LVVPIAALVVRVEEVVRDSWHALKGSLAGGVRAWNIRQDLGRHRADAILRNCIVRKWIAPISRSSGPAAGFARDAAARVGGQRVIDSNAIVGEVLTIA